MSEEEIKDLILRNLTLTVDGYGGGRAVDIELRYDGELISRTTINFPSDTE